MTKEDEWLLFNGMLPFEEVTHKLIFATLSAKTFALTTKIILPFLISTRWLTEQCPPRHRNAKVFIMYAIRTANPVWHIKHTHCVSVTTQDRLVKPILICYRVCPTLHHKLVTSMVFFQTAIHSAVYHMLITNHFIPLPDYPNDMKPAALFGDISEPQYLRNFGV